MLHKFVVHLKNVIFFKAVIFILVIGLLTFFISMLKNDHQKIMEKKNTARTILSEAKIKLDLVTHSEKDILSNHLQYEQLLSNMLDNSCINKSQIIYNIIALSDKYSLPDRIESQMTEASSPMIKKLSWGKLRIKHYDVVLKFNTPNFGTFLNILKDIQNILPENVTMIHTSSENQMILSPNNIYQLTGFQKPGFIKNIVLLRIREISSYGR